MNTLVTSKGVEEISSSGQTSDIPSGIPRTAAASVRRISSGLECARPQIAGLAIQLIALVGAVAS
jgi:hypothetical protein